jgi:hypothetical protein
MITKYGVIIIQNPTKNVGCFIRLHICINDRLFWLHYWMDEMSRDVACLGEKRSAFRVLVGKPEEKRP